MILSHVCCFIHGEISGLAVAGPVVWNSLPTAVREADSLHSFRRKLKTHSFTLCLNDWL